MEAGPRDNEETAVDEVERTASVDRLDDLAELDGRGGSVPLGNGDAAADRPRAARETGDGRDSGDAAETGEGLEARDGAGGDVRDEPGASGPSSEPRVHSGSGVPSGPDAPSEADEALVEPQELRPQRKLRVWQIAPIVVLSALGSLMFAFPLAFEPGGGTGAVVSMLGLLICGCAAGWAVVAARRVGLAWPGLPAPDSGRRPDWRILALYTVVVGTVVMLAIWRVARLS